VKPLKGLRGTKFDAKLQAKMVEVGARNGRELIAICGDASRPMEDRLQSCLLLSQLRCREALPQLIKIGFEEQEPKLVWQSVVAIGAIGSLRATRPLLRLLRSTKSKTTRHGVLVALGELADERARRALTGVAVDVKEEDNIRGLAVEALGLLKPKRQTSRFLVEALGDPSAGVRFSSLCAISALRDKKAIPFMLPLLNDASVVGEKESVADRAALVLRLIQGSVDESPSAGSG
jgi:HEAT repeat protein